jgi:hypothetical protein
LEFLWGQLLCGARLSAAGALAAGPQFAARALGPRLRRESLEEVKRDAQVLARGEPVSVSAEPHPVEQFGPRAVVRSGRMCVEAQRGIEMVASLLVACA